MQNPSRTLIHGFLLRIRTLTNNKPLLYLLLPFSWLFGLIVCIRNKLFDFGILKQNSFNIPVLSVGNITVGGTGKTPHIEYLIRLLKDDFNIAVLSRGYKRKTRGFVLADKHSSAETIGDEPCQIKQKFPDILVAVDANRTNGIVQIQHLRKDIDIILLDDAFQHRKVKPGLSILLIDYNRPLSKDFLLPFGRLREPESAKKRADIIVVSKSPENITNVERVAVLKEFQLEKCNKVFFSRMAQKDLIPVFPGIHPLAVHAISKLSVLLVSGIANPQSLKNYVLDFSQDILEMPFADHHQFTQKDIVNIIGNFESIKNDEKILITTEKDAVRLQKYTDLPEIFKQKMFYIPISVDFLNEDGNTFNNLIVSYVSKNK